MRCPATRARRATPAVMPMSPSPTARANYWPRSANSCQSDGVAMHSPPRILIVDDNETNRDILVTRLGAHGYDLVQAADGVECIEVTKASLPDLILLDVMMPKMDGIEATRRLKNDPDLPFIPIILVTAKAD